MKIIRDESGVALIMFAIALPVIMLIMALAIDLNKIQGGSEAISSATDSSASAVAEFIVLNSQDNINNAESKELTKAELDAFGLEMVATNVKNNEGTSELLPDTFSLAVNNNKVTVSACLLVKPNTLAGSAGLRDEQKVCSNSVAPIICPAGLEFDGAFCSSSCSDPNNNKLVFKITSLMEGVDHTLQAYVQQNDEYAQEDDELVFSGERVEFYTDVYKDEKMLIAAGTNYADTNEGSCGYSNIANNVLSESYQLNGTQYTHLGESVASALRRLKDDRFVCNSVLRNYAGSALSDSPGRTSIRVLYEPGFSVPEIGTIFTAQGISDNGRNNFVSAELTDCVTDNSEPLLYKNIGDARAWEGRGSIFFRPARELTQEEISERRDYINTNSNVSSCPCAVGFGRFNRCGDSFNSRRDLGRFCKASFGSRRAPRIHYYERQ